ncbi:MAG: LysR family transcriptional regulator [Thermodesulfobacteriota bacterium]
MNIDQLKAFQQVAHNGTFTLAAEKLFLTQPAVSQQVKSLETSLQVVLFDRTEKKIRLTKEGEIMLSYVQSFFDIYNEIETVAHQLNSLEKGKISIGATTVIGTYFLPRVIGNFSKKYSGIEINLRVGNSKVIHTLLQKGKIDFGFAGRLSGAMEREHSIAHREKFLMVTSPDNPILKQHNPSLTDFLNSPFVFREKGSQTRMLIKELFKKHTGKESPDKFIELHNLEAAKRMVEEGYGITLLPEIAVKKDISSGLLKHINFLEFNLCLDYYLFKGSFISRASETFLETVSSHKIFNYGLIYNLS